MIETSLGLTLRGWLVFVRLDVGRGLGRDAEGLAVLVRVRAPCGVISTHPNVVAAGGELGLAASLRVFLVDSGLLRSGLAQAERSRPDVVETLPGVLPQLIRPIAGATGGRVVPGGLIARPSQAWVALEVGAYPVSTSSLEVDRAVRAGLGSREHARRRELR